MQIASRQAKLNNAHNKLCAAQLCLKDVLSLTASDLRQLAHLAEMTLHKVHACA